MKFLVCCLLVLAASMIEGKSIFEKRDQKQCGCFPTKFTARFDATVTNAKLVPSPFKMRGRVIVDLDELELRYYAKSSDVPGKSEEITVLDVLFNIRTGKVNIDGAAFEHCWNVFLPSEITKQMDLGYFKAMVQRYKCYIRDHRYKSSTSADGKKVVYNLSIEGSQKLTYSADSCTLESLEIVRHSPGGVDDKDVVAHFKVHFESFDVDRSELVNFCNSKPINVTMQQLQQFSGMALNMGLA